MTTSMHRLQISIPTWQHEFLAERAGRDGVSIAEVIRQLVQREAEAASEQRTSVDSIWKIAGIGKDRGPLINGIPVSQAPDLYLAEMIAPSEPPEVSDAAGRD